MQRCGSRTGSPGPVVPWARSCPRVLRFQVPTLYGWSRPAVTVRSRFSSWWGCGARRNRLRTLGTCGKRRECRAHGLVRVRSESSSSSSSISSSISSVDDTSRQWQRQRLRLRQWRRPTYSLASSMHGLNHPSFAWTIGFSEFASHPNFPEPSSSGPYPQHCAPSSLASGASCKNPWHVQHASHAVSCLAAARQETALRSNNLMQAGGGATALLT